MPRCSEATADNYVIFDRRVTNECKQLMRLGHCIEANSPTP